MKNYTEIQGNLITLAQEGQFDLIAHGCNCQANMGAGIAAQIATHFPKATLIDEHGALPGTICAVTYPCGLTIVNAYTQISPGPANKRFQALSPINDYQEPVYDTLENRYAFIRHAMRSINQFFAGKRLGLPLIGCGLAGGEWERVKPIFQEEFDACDVNVVHFKP